MSETPDTQNTPRYYKDLADIVEYLFPAGSLEEDDDGQLVIKTGLRWELDGRLWNIATNDPSL